MARLVLAVEPAAALYLCPLPIAPYLTIRVPPIVILIRQICVHIKIRRHVVVENRLVEAVHIPDQMPRTAEARAEQLHIFIRYAAISYLQARNMIRSLWLQIGTYYVKRQ